MWLSDLNMGETAMITKVMGRGAFRKRITEMGFVKGRKVTAIKSAPLNDPIEYKILGYEISLRKSEAQLIEVTTANEIESILNTPFNGVLTDDILLKAAREKSKIINIALVGNPNCGKTTLFNFASNSHERVGNYSGVTVDSKTAEFKHKGYTIRITDLPGTYSLSAYSPDELFVRRHIQEANPDVVVNVIDASNMERNLYLTTQLIDMDIKVIIALNMYDELQNRGDKFDYQSLGGMIGIPFIPTVSSKGIGIREVFDKVINIYNDKDRTYRHIHINYGNELENSIQKIQVHIRENLDITARISSRFLAIKLLEKDSNVHALLAELPNYKEISAKTDKEIKRLETLYVEDSETLLTDTRYGFISGAIKETYTPGAQTKRQNTEIIDSLLTHKLFGFPIFFAFLWFMFQITFRLGEYPKQWLEMLVSVFGNVTDSILPKGPLNDLITDGIINGVGGVIVFLPNILLLFFFISFMEDTGYMARVAFIMDKLMHKIGLHGKSFIPLIMGFGCNVPAIMATRTIENRNNRLLTILINPFMSCSARLPVYILFISAFFSQKAGTVLFLIYLVGIAMAVGVALIFKNTIFKANEIPFVMELPPYRLPTLRSTLIHMWHKGEQYLKKMGGIILLASIIIWALGYFPRNVEYSRNYKAEETAIHANFAPKIAKANNDKDIQLLELQKLEEIENLELEKHSEHQEKSYIGYIGKAIEPVMAPLGFDWRMSVSLLTGIAAKEVVVSTLGVLYQANPNDTANQHTLQQKLISQKHTDGQKIGQPVFNKLVVVSFLLFVLFYFPCVAVMAAIRRETGSWKWTTFVIIYTTGIAWLFSFMFYQIGTMFM
jgi:ferrous iron transport protein B